MMELAQRVAARAAARVPAGRPSQDLCRLVLDQRVKVHRAGPDSAILFSLTRAGRAHIHAAAGRLSELLEALPQVEFCCWLRGATSLDLTGRHGWERVLADRGYCPDGQGLLVKELPRG